jgi:hypothetical protein
MSPAARSIFIFGLYVLASGLTLLLAPNLALAAAGLPATDDVWIRVMGMIVVFLGYYYLRAARQEMTDFFRWTVQTRPWPLVVFVVLVAMGLARPVIILFGLGDLLGAIWTAWALRASRERVLA